MPLVDNIRQVDDTRQRGTVQPGGLFLLFKKMFPLLHKMIEFRHQSWQTLCSVQVLIGFVQEVE